MKVKKLKVHELDVLTELFKYNDVEEMIFKCSQEIKNGIIDIFVLYDKGILVGELRTKYESNDENFAMHGKRAYMYAFRVREGVQNKGYGTYLFKKVLAILEANGYSEFTIGVEDDNLKALHMYKKMGFHQFLLRKHEEYQGDEYEYNLYLRKSTNSNFSS